VHEGEVEERILEERINVWSQGVKRAESGSRFVEQ
jgi:hypothetical protein